MKGFFPQTNSLSRKFSSPPFRRTVVFVGLCCGFHVHLGEGRARDLGFSFILDYTLPKLTSNSQDGL